MCGKHIDPNCGYINNDAYHMPKEFLDKCVDFVNKADIISLHGIGEPLTYPDLFSVLKYKQDGTLKCTELSRQVF